MTDFDVMRATSGNLAAYTALTYVVWGGQPNEFFRVVFSILYVILLFLAVRELMYGDD